jgi:YbbR domain-containing protein
MITSPLRWILRNLGTLALAFFLAAVVWVTAVVISDPNDERTSNPIPIEITGQDPNLLLIGEIPSLARITLEAPTSIWNQLDNNASMMEAWIDLSGLGAGEHTVQVNTQVDASPVRIVQVDPSEVVIVLEPLLTKNVPVQLIVNGEPPLGYQKEPAQVNPATVQLSGPESAVSNVMQARVTLDIAGASQTVTSNLDVEIVDADGAPVDGVTVSPGSVTVTQPISLLRGFRNVAVKVITEGQVANGYRLTNITVTPPTVTVSAADPLLVNELPGFVETVPVNLSNLTDDIEINVGLILPEGITLVREPSVLVQVGVGAIESSLSLPLPVEILGLPPELEATITPQMLDVIVSGPIPVLEVLTPASFRLVIDLTNMVPGVYQISPIFDLVPKQVRIDSILPETVEVILILAPTPTPVLETSIDLTPTGTPSLTPTAAPTP